MASVFVSSVLEAPADRVWARIRDFNGLPRWHPWIADSQIEGGLPADQIGCVRNFRLQNGDRIRERLLGLSDHDLFCTYTILESPMPLENYVATLRLTPVTRSATGPSSSGAPSSTARPRSRRTSSAASPRTCSRPASNP